MGGSSELFLRTLREVKSVSRSVHVRQIDAEPMLQTLANNSGSDNTDYDSFTPSEVAHSDFDAFPQPRRGLTRSQIPRNAVPRFLAKQAATDCGCVLWLGAAMPKGYGLFNLGRYADGRQHTAYAHRVAYVLAKGDIPAGCVVMHSCDTPACVNPDHLSIGSQADNLRDAVAKGRR